MVKKHLAMCEILSTHHIILYRLWTLKVAQSGQ